MKSNETIIEEDERVYLKRLHESELNICKIVSDMLETPEPFTFETDFECEPLKTLAGDPDQVKIHPYFKFLFKKLVNILHPN